jgi:membrane-associated phospholipid phosphatase
VSQPDPPGPEPIKRALESELAEVKSPEQADEVVRRVERLAAGATEPDRAERAARDDRPSDQAVERAGRSGPVTQEVARVLETTTAEAVAATADGQAAKDAATQTLSVAAEPLTPAAERGRSLLRDAVLRQMGPLGSLDARIFLAVNGLSHPRWLNALAFVVTVVTTGGGAWVFVTLVAYLLRAPQGWTGLKILLPTVVGTTWVAEYPVKSYFRRRRPFVDVVRALVVGKKPSGWSFPSGHTASSFACARVLTTVWPRRAPLIYALASLVGFSRVYVGAHYPGDVISGAVIGSVLSELFRRVAKRLLG